MDELLELWNDEAARDEMTDEQLAELHAALQEHARALLEGDRTDEVLAELDDLATTVEAIETVQQARANDAAARDERADEIATRIFGQDDGDDGEADDEPEAEADDEPEADEGDEPESVEAEAVEVEAEQVEQIAADAARFTPRVTRVAARRPAASQPRSQPASGSLVASANIGGRVQAGRPLETLEDLSEAFITAYQRTEGYRGPRTKVLVASAGSDPLDHYGEDRYLDSNARGNARKIAAVTDPQAIVASGGACVSPPVDYTQPILPGTEARPIRDEAMARFGADRAGVVTMPPPDLTDVASSVSDWTLENDENPSSPTTKPCLTITCPDETTDRVDAIVRCLKIGNFRSRFFGEQVQAWLDLAAVYQARHAETLLATAIGTGSTQTTSGTLLGTTRDVLATLDRATAAFRSRHRLAPSYSLRWVAPAYLRDQIRSDVARQMPVGTTDETFAVADAAIERWLAARRINTTWMLDDETGQVFGPQGDGPLTGWPSTAVTYLYAEGSWLFLDGGSFDFGIVRDSTLNATNDFQVFAETLEGAHFHGVESLRIALDLCPDGSAAALVDISPCSTGS